MVPLEPINVSGASQKVDFAINNPCAVVVWNESPQPMKVAIGPGQRARWLPAWVADLFSIPAGAAGMTITPTSIASTANAPSAVLLATVFEEGDVIEGTYPMALTRQTSITSGSVVIPTNPPAPAVLQNVGGVPLGDSSNSAQLADAVTENISPALMNLGAVLATFKAAAGQTIAQVGSLGAMIAGTATQVAPAFGQATTAGHFAAAAVGASPSAQEPTTTAAGWSKVISVNTNGGWIQIWKKENIGNGEAAPIFTQPNSGITAMFAVLGEWSGVATSSSTDRTGSVAGIAGLPFTTSATGLDSAGGDLAIMAVRTSDFNSSASAVFTDTFNNNAAAVTMGTAFSSSIGPRNFHAVYAIMPAVSPALPLGVSPWRYDWQSESRPTAGTTASFTIAGVAGKRITVDNFAYATITGASAISGGVPTVKDGSTEIWADFFSVAVNSFQSAAAAGKFGPGMALACAVGDSLTISDAAAPAACSEIIEGCGYQR